FWTDILITRPPPHPLAEIYLARSCGCLLDIHIDMTTPYIQGIEPLDATPQVNRALETLKSIVAHGGSLDRWRSLSIHTKVPQVLLEVTGFINLAPTPALEHLSLRWKTSARTVEQQELECLAGDSNKLSDTYSLSHGPGRPHLRHVDLDGMPSAFVFTRKSVFLSNLTKLKLVCAHTLYTIENISTLLAANPELEHLTLDMGLSSTTSAGAVRTGPHQVPLPRLRYFSLNATNAYDWGVFLLQIVDAPNLETFEVHANTYSTLNDSDPATVPFICIGRRNGALLHNGTNNVTGYPPVYGTPFPALKHFNLKHAHTASRQSIKAMLVAYPTVTEVTANFVVLSVLSEDPQLLPNLTHLMYSDTRRSNFPGTMQRLALSRVRAGRRLQSVTIEFTGRAAPWFYNDSEDIPLDYRTPLENLVGKLDVYDRLPPYEPDSDVSQSSSGSA
ncbi:hypothetical protein FRC09_014593, partial [Ceratobasidium sp. 395]